MRNLFIALLLLTRTLSADDSREINFAREMLEDAVIRNDEEGMRLVRERLLRVVAEADDRTVLRDAHYLVAFRPRRRDRR